MGNKDKMLQSPRTTLDIAVPEWVPAPAITYLAHTETGVSIRALARDLGCHASTVLRQIRRMEMRRDDPLIDSALRTLGRSHFQPDALPTHFSEKEAKEMSLHSTPQPDTPMFAAEAARVLRRLCETGAVMAVAAKMEKAVIVRDTTAGSAMRTGVVDREIAEAMALKDWVTPAQTGKITRYSITAAGRSALEKILETMPRDTAQGFAESQAPFEALSNTSAGVENPAEDTRQRRYRYNLAESPLVALARRKDKGGEPFLSPDLVSAGEHLREDFELAQMGPRTTQNWERFLTAGARETYVADSGVSDAPSNARQRVADALAELGPGLADVVLRCCCYLEGLEAAEKKLGWSARSGKIVLRIALIRLKRHYDETVGPGGPLIG